MVKSHKKRAAAAFSIIFYSFLYLSSVTFKVIRKTIDTQKLGSAAIYKLSVNSQLVAAKLLFTAFFAVHITDSLLYFNKLAAIYIAIVRLKPYCAALGKYSFVFSAVTLMKRKSVSACGGKSYIEKLKRHFRSAVAEVKHTYGVIAAA